MLQKHISEIIEVMPQNLWRSEEVKNYLRVSHNYDDSLISSLIGAAIIAAENFTGLILTPRRIKFISNLRNNKIFHLKYKPVNEITKIIFKNFEQELEIRQEQYYLDKVRWVICTERPLIDQELVIEYVAGFREDNIPPPVKNGILLHVAEMYDREQGDISGLPTEVKNLYSSYRQLKI